MLTVVVVVVIHSEQQTMFRMVDPVVVQVFIKMHQRAAGLVVQVLVVKETVVVVLDIHMHRSDLLLPTMTRFETRQVVVAPEVQASLRKVVTADKTGI